MSRNIVLIGMPGAGKTTIGKMLYDRLALKFIDVDEFIVETSGKTIPELFDVGESHFRQIETMAVKKLSKDSSTIIATGGGVVKNKENIEELRKHGMIVFIDRPVEDIAADVEISERPLLKDGVQKLYDLHRERYSLYMEYSDFHVVNNCGLEAAVDRIVERYALS
jgi:shikimate kinase